MLSAPNLTTTRHHAAARWDVCAGPLVHSNAKGCQQPGCSWHCACRCCCICSSVAEALGGDGWWWVGHADGPQQHGCCAPGHCCSPGVTQQQPVLTPASGAGCTGDK